MNECPVCSGTKVHNMAVLEDVPAICNELWADAESARLAPLGQVDLVCCENCSMIWNRVFDPSCVVYAPDYENALHFSPTFRSFADKLAGELVERHALKGKTIVEIGCGDGYFLDLMAQHGVADAIGFDPSMKGRPTPFCDREGVKIHPELFDPSHIDHHFDFIICRHVLEHLDNPASFLRSIRTAIGPRNVSVYFEVPNARWMLDTLSLWDVIYEHVGYWSDTSIDTLFRRSGFRPTALTTGYNKQFLMIEAVPSEADPTYVAPKSASIVSLSQKFAKALNDEISRWSKCIEKLDGTAVIWGAGSKGIMFANAISDGAGKIVGLIDVNPRKPGKFIPGMALPVLSPDSIRQIDPDLVLISNGLYKEEIKSRVHSTGVNPVFGTISE